MALNPDLISFFLRNIQQSNRNAFGSEVAHLFEHLSSEIKDNPIYQIYEERCALWKKWEGLENGYWSLPSNFDDAKSLIYSLYRLVAEKGKNGYEIASDLMYFKNGNYDLYVNRFNEQFLDYFKLTLDEIIKANPEIEGSSNITDKATGDTVFIIHGHDNELKMEVQLLLTRAGVNNLVLHEQPDKGRTIIDKLVEESLNSNYAIALLSPDDKLENGTGRARQNVILEVGYFIGRLGKERVRILKKGETEIPSDLQGILYENHDNSGAWKMRLCKELMAVGIFVVIESVAKTL